VSTIGLASTERLQTESYFVDSKSESVDSAIRRRSESSLFLAVPPPSADGVRTLIPVLLLRVLLVSPAEVSVAPVVLALPLSTTPLSLATCGSGGFGASSKGFVKVAAGAVVSAGALLVAVVVGDGVSGRVSGVARGDRVDVVASGEVGVPADWMAAISGLLTNPCASCCVSVVRPNRRPPVSTRPLPLPAAGATPPPSTL